MATPTTDTDEYILPPDEDGIAEAMSAGPAPTRRKPNPLAAEVERLRAANQAFVDQDIRQEAEIIALMATVERLETERRLADEGRDMMLTERNAARDLILALLTVWPLARAIVRYADDPTGLAWESVEVAVVQLPADLRAELEADHADRG